ncbi:hypothetical protein [Petrachloros mirabilis]
MSAGSWWLKNPFLLKLFRESAKMTNRFFNAFSLHKQRQSIKGTASFSQSGVYSEEAFRYLLESESKRSERSGHLYQILIVYCVDAQGRSTKMDTYVAETVMAALWQSLRETDYIGWYREGVVAGGVLTVVGRDAATDLYNRLQQRLAEFLRTELGAEEVGRLRIRMCHHQELQGMELGEEMFAVR